MLENLRRKGASVASSWRSIFVYLIFGLLIVIFVINFAPSRKSGDEGCRGTSNVVVSVDGSDANQSAYHVAYSYAGFTQNSGRQRVYFALEMLIRRELLAQAGAARGLRVSGELADEEIKHGFFFIGGQRVQLGGQIFDEVDGEKFFNIKKYKGWVNALNVSPGSYRDEQSRGLQAAMMANLIEGSVRVTRDEALADYLYDNNTVTYDVVAFSPADYRSAMRLTDADVQRFLTAHEDDVKARYKTDERTYKGTKPQLKLRSIFIAKAEPPAAPPAPPADDKKPADAKPGDAAKPDDKKPDDKKPDDKKVAAKPIGMSIEDAKAKLEEARAAVAAGKKKFAEVAAVLGTDEAIKANGGDLGWRTVDNAQLGDKAVSDAVKTLKPGEMTPVIATDHGVYLVLAEDKREGDLGYDQVRLELARDLALDAWSKEAAKRAALATLTTAGAGPGKKLEDMFEREVAKPRDNNNSIEEMLNDPSMPPEQKQKIIEMLKQQMEQKHGSLEPGLLKGGLAPTLELEIETKDVLAGWTAEPDGAGGGAASGSSGSAPATGSAATPATPAVPPAPVEVVASKDVLPALGEVAKAKVNRVGPTPRMTKMPGIGGSKEAAEALFGGLAAGGLAGKVYETDGSFVVVQLITKTQPKVEDFDKDADHQIEMLRKARAQATIEDWLKNRCESLAKAGKIKPASELIRESDDQGKPLPTVYRPCMSFR